MERTQKRGELLLASGPDLEHLTNRGIALPWAMARQNPKEAEIVRAGDGSWIGIARAERVDGPWTVEEPLFEARPGWDCWHLSTGPVVYESDRLPVMFYNGATRDAQWRIGYVVFDRDFTRVVARGEHPLVLPGERRNAEDTDIAFAASAIVERDRIHLYYSVADRHVMRAIVRRSEFS